MRSNEHALHLLACLVFTAISYWFFDNPLALLFHRISRHGVGTLLSVKVPDLLLPIMLIVTGAAWGGYIYLRSRTPGTWPAMLRLLGLTVPISYVVSNLLKVFFGRTDVRVWVTHPGLDSGFHLFRGGSHFSSFPSGHMALFSAFLLTFASFYPRQSWACVGLMALLGAALVVTNHHFASDVIAGLCVGMTSRVVSSNLLGVVAGELRPNVQD